MITFKLAPGLLLLVLACASGGSGGATGGEAAQTQAPRGSRDVISQAEVENADVTNAYDLIRRLRPEYLRSRGGGGTVVFYLDNVKMTGADQLQTVAKDAVREVRYLNATDATMRFGLDHSGGAVIVSTRR